jgi:hypothetical protein
MNEDRYYPLEQTAVALAARKEMSSQHWTIFKFRISSSQRGGTPKNNRLMEEVN